MELKTPSHGGLKRAALVREMDQHVSDPQSAHAFEEALHVLALQIRISIGAHQCAISYIPHGNFNIAVHTHSFSEKYEKYNSYDVMPTGEGIWGLVVQHKRAVRMTQAELAAQPMWKNFSDLKDARGLEHPPMRGWLAAPVLRQNGEILGVLQLSDKNEDAEFTAEDLAQLIGLANMVLPTFELHYVNQQLHKSTIEREQSAAALAREQFLLQALVDNIPEPVFFKDRQSRFIRANRKMAHDAGFTDPAELIGKTDADIWAGDLPQETLADEQRIIETGEPLMNKEEMPMKKGGPERWVLVTKMPLRDESGVIVGLFGVAWDITREKQQAKELEAHRLAALNIAQDAEDARWASQKANADLEREIALRRRAERAALNIAQDAEEARRASDQANAELEREIALRRQAEQDLRKAHAFLDSIVEHVPLLLFVKKAGDLRYERLNKAAAELLGFTQDDSLGRGDYDFFPKEQADFFAAKDRETLQNKRLVDIPEEPIQTRQGERILHTRKIPILDAHGNPSHLLGISEDITERKRAEEQLKQLAAELARSNAELEQFAYIASHDLQEPLRKVQAFGDMLTSKYREALGEEGRDYLQRMQNASKRMQGLINDLLTFSRLTTKARPFEDVDLAHLARQVVADLEIRIRDTGGRVEVGQLPVLEAEPTQMRQLLQNLIGNALKFHREKVAPVVTVQGRAGRSRQLDDGKTLVQCWEIEVRDNGIGFEEKNSERIFVPFQRLHSRDEYEGTGMGLAICRKIVERHGGSITVRSVPGRGSTFRITLPVRQRRRT